MKIHSHIHLLSIVVYADFPRHPSFQRAFQLQLGDPQAFPGLMGIICLIIVPARPSPAFLRRKAVSLGKAILRLSE